MDLRIVSSRACRSKNGGSNTGVGSGSDAVSGPEMGPGSVEGRALTIAAYRFARYVYTSANCPALDGLRTRREVCVTTVIAELHRRARSAFVDSVVEITAASIQVFQAESSARPAASM